ncbi:dihydrolipoyl dehydrogenase [Virgibacillus dakarensis]|uniref:Dihydrolipoyl dehydrogenase n=1 Tax=Lentibacillus populi TaxID=1827502 RepID=A0A9W5TW81_9BACI|nr:MULTISPECIES: dihydrolipoyl dehydrogenase [Bacillaceae]MBT2217285.1 dihydrolipoyl dehydrogenase [Virgibacillus dakarensis]MTW86780.1 dihydrolipoyl dehydrogenase [Virgibacillus dakarensis]GGB38301.1 dihydrolipoyl dehydrogenase [Lentibacillus populi]
MVERYDVVILGGGTGGYVAAIKSAQNKQTVAVIEKDKLGGTCLHRGCIPSKALLRTAEVLATFKKADSFGIDVESSISLNFQKAQKRKTQIVSQLEAGIKGLMAKGKIDVYEGTGYLKSNKRLTVNLSDGKQKVLQAKNVIIATGSQPRALPGLAFDEQNVLSSNGILSLTTLPKSILIVGGGVIGMEWASMLHDFGVDVTVLEYSPRILPTEDEAISNELLKLYKSKKVKIVTSAQVDATSYKTTASGVEIAANIDGEGKTFKAEKILVSVGRDAVTNGIGLSNTNIKLDNRVIKVNDKFQTDEKNIYAIGDCIGSLQLAHVAIHEAITAVDTILKKEVSRINYEQIARCTYTSPEIASIGITEAVAKERGYTIKVGQFPFSGIGKALVYGATEGFVKIIADADTDDILGIFMIGPHATDMISEVALGQFLEATPWELGHTIHPHPTLSEVIGEAVLAVNGEAIHM